MEDPGLVCAVLSMLLPRMAVAKESLTRPSTRSRGSSCETSS